MNKLRQTYQNAYRYCRLHAAKTTFITGLLWVGCSVLFTIYHVTYFGMLGLWLGFVTGHFMAINNYYHDQKIKEMRAETKRLREKMQEYLTMRSN